jgi:hypothetical protein
MMYNPPTFLTPEVLAGVLAEFSWPAPYTLEDDRPDGIVVKFPLCHLYVSEGFESNMDLTFLPESTGLDESVSVAVALEALRTAPARVLPPPPSLLNYFSPQASLEKVVNELRDLCTLLSIYFQSALVGNFDWIGTYKNHQ